MEAGQDSIYNDHSRYGLSQWETTLHCNVVSHWLGPYPQWSLSTAMTKVDHVLRPTHIYLHGQAMGISTCMGKLWGVYSTSEKYNVSSKYDYWEQTPLINDLIYPIIYQHYVTQACYHSPYGSTWQSSLQWAHGVLISENVITLTLEMLSLWQFFCNYQHNTLSQWQLSMQPKWFHQNNNYIWSSEDIRYSMTIPMG